jgi:hypothetical protein
MMVDWTKPIETVTGQQARVLVTDLKPRPYIGMQVCAAVAVLDSEGFENVHPVSLDGKNGSGTPFIRNKPVKREGWINVYRQRGTHENNRRCVLWLDKAAADDEADQDRLACIRIEWEEPAHA